jgi:uracil phosphoribosyltransferase
MAVYTGGLYFNFAWFREQLCIVICPYGRLQSALIDSHSLVVGYDAQRGEPRGKPGTPGTGDCVSCNRCVHVCPTGIDIRQGLQMECIGCTACIDACDAVMTKLKRPAGLIRYDSQAAFAGNITRWLRPRTFLYGALLAAGASVALWAISTIRPANLGITRMTGARLATPTTIVPILRAGLAMMDGLLALFPEAHVGHVGIYRDEATAQPITYYAKFPPNVADGPVILVDPMLATGGSAVHAVSLLRQKGCRDIRLMCLVAAPEGIAALHAAHPELPIHVAAVDERLNERFYIVPGLGDAGDRIFGTQ